MLLFTALDRHKAFSKLVQILRKIFIKSKLADI
jgi:hypothetical protein